MIDRVRRTSFLELFSDAEALKHTRIIDTPGTGSANDDHEKVAQNFLDAEKSSIAEGEKADALIYVFGYLGKEADEQSLQTFRKGCLPGSSPYNSVGVFHLWDNTYWDNGGDMNDIERKAEQLKNHMRDVVADIIPVSAPLALAAQLAPDGFSIVCNRLFSPFRKRNFWRLSKEIPAGTERKNKPLSGACVPGYRGRVSGCLSGTCSAWETPKRFGIGKPFGN